MFSLLRAGWGKVNSLGIWRMRRVLLWLRTKCNPLISPISEPRTELFVGELDRPYRASEHFEQGLSPPCVVTQILHVFWHSKLKSLSCLAQAISLMDCIPPYTRTYQNLLSNEGVTCSIFFCLAGKSRFLGCLSSQPAQLYHEGQKEYCDLRSREAKDEAPKMPSALPSNWAEKVSTTLQTPSCF